mgnify:CR=1 FL=1
MISRRHRFYVVIALDLLVEFRKGIEEATRNLDPTDMEGLQKLMYVKRELQDIQKLHISVN